MELTIEVIYNISFDLKRSYIQRLNFENRHYTYRLSQILNKYHVSNLKHTQLQELYKGIWSTEPVFKITK